MIICITCREVVSGDTLYIKTATREETLRLLKLVDVTYIGKPFVLFNAERLESLIHGSPVYEAPLSLIPGNLKAENAYLNVAPATIQSNKKLGSFLVEVEDLKLTKISILEGCSSRFCDAR